MNRVGPTVGNRGYTRESIRQWSSVIWLEVPCTRPSSRQRTVREAPFAPTPECAVGCPVAVQYDLQLAKQGHVSRQRYLSLSEMPGRSFAHDAIGHYGLGGLRRGGGRRSYDTGFPRKFQGQLRRPAAQGIRPEPFCEAQSARAPVPTKFRPPSPAMATHRSGRGCAWFARP
eukprot:COSAG06_NODE_517_length_14783_cov_54.650027_2_plen_172_part_00